MRTGIGPKQHSILLILKSKQYIDTGAIKHIYGYNTSAKSALAGLAARGFIELAHHGKYKKGPNYSEAFE